MRHVARVESLCYNKALLLYTSIRPLFTINYPAKSLDTAAAKLFVCTLLVQPGVLLAALLILFAA